jgi:O-acetyl-ADP-ribose deacetylase (regulator of RNase III)
MQLAADHDLRSIAFPAISTGAYGFPVERAARIAVTAVNDALSHPTSVELVRFVCFSERDWNRYLELLGHRRDQ